MAKAAVAMKQKSRQRDEDEDNEGEEVEEDERRPVNKGNPKSKGSVPSVKAKARRDEEEEDNEQEDDTEGEGEGDDTDGDVYDNDGDDEDAPKATGKHVYDMSDADPDATFEDEVVPNNTYTCEVVATDFSFSQKKGSPMMRITLDVIKGPYAKSKTRPTAKRFWLYSTLGEKTLNMLAGHLRAIGVPSKIYKSPKFSDKTLQRIADSGECLGAIVRANVGKQKYGEGWSNNVKSIKRAKDDDVDSGSDGFVEEQD